MIELNSSAYSTAAAGLTAPPRPARSRLQLVSAQPAAAGNELHLRQPISLPFLGFIIALVGTGAATYLQPGATTAVTTNDLTLINRLGVIGSTVFVLAACAIGYRAATTRSPAMVPIALLLIGPGAWWNWGLFSEGQPSTAALSSSVTLLVVVASAAIAGCLLLEATRNTRWLGVYCGLGSTGLAAAAVLVRINEAAAQTVSLSMMMTLAALACLYGTLVEIEAVRRQSLEQLLSAKAKTEAEIAQAEGVLHDLRSGLLSIEAAIGSFDSDLAGPLRNEAARLRQLTVRSKRQVSNFDLVPGLRDLAQARRPSGLMIDVRLPGSALVRGEEGELLSVVDNLLSNAQRHGRAPVRLEAGEQDGWIWVAVTDSGSRSTDLQPGRIFRRGHSTHPDGEGIGLNRAQVLAEKNHGRLMLDTEHQGGARFVLALPAVLPAHARPVEPEVAHQAPPPVYVDPQPPATEPAPGYEPNFDYLDQYEPGSQVDPGIRSEVESGRHIATEVQPQAEPSVHFEPAPPQSETWPAPAITLEPEPFQEPDPPVAVVTLEPEGVAEQSPPPGPTRQTAPTSPPPVPDPVPDRPPRTRHGAREPWVWPDPASTPDPGSITDPAAPHAMGPLTPPLPPPSMALEEAVEEAPTDAEEIVLDDGTVIDLARSTDQIPMDLPTPSEFPTGPVPAQT